MEQFNMNANETICSIGKSNKLDVSGCGGADEPSLQHSTAPTLPLLSPHSPLLTDENSHHLNKNKLSVRYINNTTPVDYNFSQQRPQLTKQQSSVKYRSSTRIGNSFQTTNDTTLSSKLLCYCEKSGLDSKESSSNKSIANACIAKRLVPTRNAATSPHLDVRKLGSMTKLSPSLSLANEIVSKTKDFRINDLKCNNFIKENKNFKVSLEKTNSLGESKPLKQLRTTRSLSPRPPIRHQHAIIASDCYDFDFKLSTLSKTIPYDKNGQKMHKKSVNNLCRSEQSSPNIMDGTGIKFAYNKSTNYSTGCLGYAPSDPWLKLVDTKIISSNIPNSLPPKKSEKLLSPAKTLPENNEDPWVKRTDMQSVPKSPRQELFRQCKSFSATKIDPDTVSNFKVISSNPCKLPGGYIINDINTTSVTDVRKKLQSAPSSPHFLTTSENPFSSACYLNNQYVLDPFNNKTPTRSSSFSPARIKDCQNPFTDFNLPAHIPNSPPPMISVATESNNDQQNSKSNENNRTTNYSFLNVCNPHFINTRHSFSSVSNQRQDEELQLNIRRLSDQMRRKGSNIVDAIRGNMKTYSSDRNVSGKPKEANKFCTSTNKKILDTKTPLNRADFSDYLEQFRCSEAKKAAAKADEKEQRTLWDEKKIIKKTISNQQMIISKTQQSTDFLLETTC